MLYFLRDRFTFIAISLCLYCFIPSQPGYAGWVKAATHPGAHSQPGVIGRTIVELERVGRRIYTGYGDYGLNTGPIKIFAYGLNSRRLTFQGLTLQTEAVLKFRQAGRRVFAIGADARGSARHHFAVRDRLWTARNNIDASSGSSRAEHIYDVVVWRGELWAAGGMANNHAGLWRSDDNGANWRLELDVPPAYSNGSDVARFYFIGRYRNELYVQSVDICNRHSCPRKSSLIYDGNRWRSGADLLMGRGTGYPADKFAGKMILRNYENAYYPQNLHVFDGKSVSRPLPDFQTIHDYTISDDGHLYALTTFAAQPDGRHAQKILRTKNLKQWECVFLAPFNGTARSIETVATGADNSVGTIYLGTTRSTIVKRRMPRQGRCPANY